MRKFLWVLPLLSWAAVQFGCAGNCTVEKDEASGTATITCPDGSSVQVAPGRDGKDGAPGTNPVGSLVRLQEMAAGTDCPAGGTEILTGSDVDHDGVLDAEEVTDTRTVCSGAGPTSSCSVLEGSYTIRNSLDWQNLVRSGCTTLTGELLIEAPGLTALTPAAPLTSVGSLRFTGNTAITELGGGLPELNRIAGALEVTENTVLAVIDFPKLAMIEGSMRVDENPALQSVLLTELASVTDSLELGIFPSDGLPVLETVAFPKLGQVGGTFRLWRVPALKVFSVPELTTVGPFWFAGVEDLAQVAFPKLVTADALNIAGGPGLVSIQLPSLVSVGGSAWFSAFGVPAPVTLEAPKLTTTGSLYVAGPFAVSGLFPELTTVTESLALRVTTGVPTVVSLPKLSSVGGGLEVAEVSGVTRVEFPELLGVGSRLSVGPSAQLASVSFPKLASAGDLFLQGNATLANVVLPELTSVPGSVALGYPWETADTSALTTLSLPKLTSAGYVTAWGCPVLTTLSLPRLVTVRAVSITSNPALVSLSLPELTEVLESLSLGGFNSPPGNPALGNAALVSISLPKLASVAADVTVANNAALATFAGPLLRSIGGALTVKDNPVLPQCHVDALRLALTSGPASYTASGNAQACPP